MENFNSESSRVGLPTKYQPSFFQICLPGHNSTMLHIPPPFIKNFNGNIPEKISLKNLSGRVWPAKLGYINEKLQITKGWNCYTKEHSLKSGEFVILTYLPKATFLVKVYGSDGLIKQEPQEKTTLERAGGAAVGDLRFNMTFRKRNFVTFPKRIVNACAITLPQSIKLSNEKGVSITTELRDQQDRVVVGYTGLAYFWKANGVQDGDNLEFRVICGGRDKIEGIVMKNITQSEELRRGY